MRKWATGIVIVLSITIVSLVGWNFLKSLATVNEPDPAKFDPAIIVRILKDRGVNVRVDKVRYVYLDVFSYVFEGEIKNIDQSVWHVSRGGSLWTRKPKGVIFLSESKSGTCLIGFSDQSADLQMEPHFEKHYMEYSSPMQRLI